MVLTVFCSWRDEDVSSLSGKLNKSGSDTYSTIEESYSVNKPITITNEHIDLPEILQEESEDVFTRIIGETKKDLSIEDNSEEIFNSHINRNIKADINRRNIVDKAFEKYEDPYAKFTVSKTPKTPGPTRTPCSLFTSPLSSSTKSWKYTTEEEREARRRAALEAQRDFCQVLIKKGIDPDDYVSSVFSSSKKNGQKFKFECSTPKTGTFSESAVTPLTEKSNINTPLSGIKKLPYFSGEKSFTPSNLCLTSRLSDISLNETFSPVHDLSPTTKSSLLAGIVCYVDVRSENEDMTKSVQAELLTLGARIEKNFTKKVTHVVFKEGRVSTYLKAKKEEIPLVSVLWIEACKRVRGVADPAQYPPRRLEKYENILPFQTIKKRRLKFFNPNSKIRKNILENLNDPTFVPTLNGKRLGAKKAATVCKDKAKVVDEDKENKGIRKYCTKKLFFDKCEELFNNKNDMVEDNENSNILQQKNGEEQLDDSCLESVADIKRSVVRRKSAPPKLLLKKNDTEKTNKDLLHGNSIIELSDESQNDDNINRNIDSTNETGEKNINNNIQVIVDSEPPDIPPKKKRKLYDPNEVYVSLDEGEVSQKSIEHPIKRPRTKATASRQLVKLALARKRGNNKVKIGPVDDDNDTSPSTFVDSCSLSGTLKTKRRKEHPIIVFTSVHRSDLPKYTEMVKKLGKFVVENEVTKRTTHVLCNGPRRTLNLIKGIARGCWILDIKWLNESVINDKWLPEDNYIMSEDYPCIAECCRERRGLKTSNVIDIFKNIGSIYVSKAAVPSKKDLDQLLKICFATISKSSSTADIKVGGSKPNPKPSGAWVSEKWIIDSITQNTLQPFHPYIINIDGNNEKGGSQE